MGFLRPAQQFSWENFQKHQFFRDFFYYTESLGSLSIKSEKIFEINQLIKKIPLMSVH
jgi:hypothetical protein